MAEKKREERLANDVSLFPLSSSTSLTKLGEQCSVLMPVRKWS